MGELASIIIPAYNAERYISEAIESVINQTYTNWELIIVNDGSTDNTEKIAQSYAQKDSRITYITQENKGVSVARNIGYNASKGDYLGFLDADDYWLPDNLDEKINYFNLLSSELNFREPK